MNRIRRLCALAALLPCGFPAHGQLALPPETDLFGDEIVRKIEIGERFRGGGEQAAGPVKAKVAGFDHALVFQDGRELRGELVELTKKEIVWRRPDAGAPLRFVRGEVRRVVLGTGAEVGSDAAPRFDKDKIEAGTRTMIALLADGLGTMIGEVAAQLATADAGRAVRIPNVLQILSVRMLATAKEMGMGGGERDAAAVEKEPVAATATLKLPGGDWLFGSVTSADGETFSLKLADGTVLAIPRAPVAWLHCGAQPAPAFGFAGGVLDLESWPVRSPGTRAEVAGGTLTLREGWLLGRPLTPPKRFEVAFEIPDESEEGLRLWIQPFGPQANCWGSGTIQLVFGKKELSRCIYLRNFERKKTPLPKEAAGEKGPVSYRVLYDGLGKRLAVLRNGALLGDWSFFEDADQDANAAPNDNERSFTINGLCFDAEQRDNLPGLKFNRLRVQPWDGALPKGGGENQTGDRLSVGKERPELGRLDALDEHDFIFSGAKKPRTAGAFLELPETVPPLAEADALLIFGQQGEISAADLEVRAGRAHGRTAFAAALDLPAGALQSIAFPNRAAGAEPVADALVFKNGDVLRGTLLSAAAGGAVRWKMPGGEEVEWQTAHLAGVRFAAGGDAQKVAAPAALELRNGDRLRGEFVALDGRQLQFQHALFGTVTIDRGQAWSLFPNPHFLLADGGNNPAEWLGEKPAQKPDGVPAAGWIVLDGSFTLRGQMNRGNSDDERMLTVPAGKIPERFEVRAEATDAGGALPNFGVSLESKDNKTVLTATFSYLELTLYFRGGKTRGRSNYKNVSLREKLPVASSRMALRVFVDRKAGTADFLLNGMLVARTGQQAVERLPGIGEVVRVTVRRGEEMPVVLSNLWVGPWNGELPRAGEGTPPGTALANGDVAPGAPLQMGEGKCVVESEAGALELALEKVQAVEFGGLMRPEKAAARVRLADGGALSVEDFRWAEKELTARSATLGEVRLPAAAVSELIFAPAPVRPPRTPPAKKLAQKILPDAASEVNSDEPKAP